MEGEMGKVWWGGWRVKWGKRFWGKGRGMEETFARDGRKV